MVFDHFLLEYALAKTIFGPAKQLQMQIQRMTDKRPEHAGRSLLNRGTQTTPDSIIYGFRVFVPQNPDCVYIVPVESDQFRCACDRRLRVYRTRNNGASWEPLMRGLPQSVHMRLS